MKSEMRKTGWVALGVTAVLLLILGLAFAQQTGKKVSSYTPIVIQENLVAFMRQL